MLCAARRDRDTPASGATMRHALATGAADRQRPWQRAHPCRTTPPQLAAMLIDHRDDGNPRTYVSHVGLAADGYVATDRSAPLYCLVLTVRASIGLRSTLIVRRRSVRTDVDAPAGAVSYTHLRAHETDSYLVCRLLLE